MKKIDYNSKNATKKTSKKVLNQIMPIKALDGATLSKQPGNRPGSGPGDDNNGFGDTSSMDSASLQPIPDNNEEKGDTGIPMTFNWHNQFNSAHYGNVNLDTAQGVNNLMGITAAVTPNTIKKDNQHRMFYGYNPQPNGSGTQAIYKDGGSIQPIYTSNPNDPRLKTYNDSLKLHNLGNLEQKRSLGKDSYNENNYTPYDGMYIKNPDRNANMKEINNLSKKSGINSVGYYPAESDLPAFKKPIQPIIYKNPIIDNLQKLNTQNQQLPTYSNPQQSQPLNIQNPNLQQDNNFLNGSPWENSTDRSPDWYDKGYKNGGKIYEDGGDLDDNTSYDEEAAYGIRMQGQGNIQPISSNPYSDSILLHEGPSHEEGGIKQSQFGTKLETEGGETQYGPTILGNMKFPKVNGVSIPDFTGTKFKNIGLDIADKENKEQRIATKASAFLKADPTDKYSSLTNNTGTVLMDRVAQNQKSLTNQKEQIASIQQKMLDLSEETGVDPKKIHTTFRNGGRIKKADDGILLQQKKMLQEHPDWVKEALTKYGMPAAGRFDDGKDGPRTQYVKNYVQQKASSDPIYDNSQSTIPEYDKAPTTKNPNYIQGLQRLDPSQMSQIPTSAPMPITSPDQLGKAPAPLSPWVDPKRPKSLADSNKLGVTDFLPQARYLLERPDQVTSQQYNPKLFDPYQVSFQDRINRNDSTFRAISQQSPNNIGALSIAAAGTYDANNSVAAEEFRTNQSIFNNTMNNNYSLMNEAEKINLGANDMQMQRQAQAKSNTEAHKAQALASISDMIDQNRLENNNIRMMEARHKFTWDPKTNSPIYNGGDAPFDFSGQGSGTYNPGEETREYDAEGNLIKTIKKNKTNASAKWGGVFRK